MPEAPDSNGESLVMQTNEWSLSKRARVGEEYQLAGHRIRVVEINKACAEYNLCEVEYLGPVKPEYAPLKFDGVFTR